MKSPGSVLIVVLGLLAILAIVGVTFVTMSSMDRSTASNFAIQSQFMLAADGAIDYVCDHLVKDLWQFFPFSFRSGDPLIPTDDPYMVGTPLLTDLKDVVDPHTGGSNPYKMQRLTKYCAYIRNEPWDAPGAFPPTGTPPATGLPEDPWLATTLDMKTLTELAAAEAQNLQSLPTLGVNFAYSYGFYLGPVSAFPATPAVVSQSPYGMYSGSSPCWWKDAKAGTGFDYTNRANNLGIPGGLPEKDYLIDLTNRLRARHVDPYWPPSGVWIPDLSFPFEAGIIRVSVTVQDHNALLNANIHENGGRSNVFTKDLISGTTGRGYFVSDVALLKDTLGIDPNYLLNGTTRGTRKISGRWPKDDQAIKPNCPTNASLMETEIENPTGATGTSGLLRDDRPFTLEEEFELRRYLGTSYCSRLEAMGGTNFEIDPAMDALAPNELKLAKRMALTTVGWTSEVRPDPWAAVDPASTATALYHQGSPGSGTYSGHKADVNLDEPEYIFRSLWYARCFNHTDAAKMAQVRQFIANMIGFRDGRNGSGLQSVSPRLTTSTKLLGTEGVCAASRQPIIDKVFLTAIGSADANGNVPYTFQVELLSPWEGNCVGDIGGLSYPQSCTLVFKSAGGSTVDSVGMGGTRATNRVLAGCPLVGIDTYTRTVTVPNGSTLAQTVSTIQLTAQFTSPADAPATAVTNTIVIDEMRAEDFAGIETQRKKYRPVYIAYDPLDKLGDYRGNNNNKGPGGKENPVRVVYIGDWAPLEDGAPGADVNKWAQPTKWIPDTLPIRFPRSCDKNRTVPIPATTEYKGLPPIATSTCASVSSQEGTFKAIPRLGDLSQILWWDGTGAFWPWTTRVSKKQITKTAGLFPGVVTAPTINYLDPTQYSNTANFCIYYFANALCTGGPWSDGLDNDGDGAWDEFQPGSVGLKLDTGEKGNGQLLGPELRVAGKINLNTATQDTLEALETGVGITKDTLWDAVKKARQTGRILTPAFLLDTANAGQFTITSDPTGTLTSPDDMRREAFARISNIVTVRSDTFSIYGTVQYVDVASFKRKTPAPTSLAPFVKRTRRFWALVDRSPTAAYSPADTTKFMHPRVMNFQWMD